jgi:hypothetical protein
MWVPSTVAVVQRRLARMPSVQYGRVRIAE